MYAHARIRFFTWLARITCCSPSLSLPLPVSPLPPREIDGEGGKSFVGLVRLTRGHTDANPFSLTSLPLLLF